MNISVYKNQNGNWEYRLSWRDDSGKRRNTTRKRDDDNQTFGTKKEAQTHAERTAEELKHSKSRTADVTFEKIWDIYLHTEAKNKAESTVIKHKSVWENHVREPFSNRGINSVTSAEIEQFLLEKYLNGYKYRYVESLLKVFCLLYGIAHRHEKIDDTKYNKMFANRDTKVRMPKIRQKEAAENEEIVVYSSAEIAQIAEIMRDSNLYTAFLFAYLCGLRIGEIFGLMWNDVDYANKTIRINKQLQRYNSVDYLVELKTKNSVRTVDMPQMLVEHLAAKHRDYCKNKDLDSYHNYEIVIDKTDEVEQKIVGGDFINRKKSGELLTIRSVTFWTKEVRRKTGIDFHFHGLRSTHLSMLASQHVPPTELQKRAGHSKFDTTMRYYVNTTTDSHDQLINCINNITLCEKMITYSLNGSDPQTVPESKFLEVAKIACSFPSSQTDLKILQTE